MASFKSSLSMLMHSLLIFGSITATNDNTTASALNPISSSAFLPNAKVIAFDLREVLVTRTPAGMLRTLWSYDHKLAAISSPRLIGRCLSLLAQWIISPRAETKRMYVEEKMIQAAQEHKNDALALLIRRVTNLEQVIKGMPELVKELREQGYTLQIASNISEPAFAHLTNPNNYPALHNTLFHYFDLENSQTSFYKKDKPAEVVKKPDAEFFAQYINKNNLGAFKEKVIFIDNKKENIDAAQKAGLHAILFKNVDQLRDELKKLEILS